MRNLLLSSCLIFAACDSNNLTSVKDMATAVVNNDLSMEPDLLMTGPVCDVVAQNCPTGQHCTIVSSGTGQNTMTLTNCMPDGAGTVALGQPCTRNNDTIGDDNCGGGLFCTARGATSNTSGQQYICGKLCDHASDCATGQGCTAESDDGLTGVCVTKCTPFLGEGKGGCSSTMDCTSFEADTDSSGITAIVLDYFCRSVVGSGDNGADCMSAADCIAGYTCDFNELDNALECLQLCDDSHACAVADLGLTCTPFFQGRTMMSNITAGSCQ